MRKFAILFCILLLNTASSFAATQIKVAAQSEFRTTEPAQTINVTIKQDIALGEYNLKDGDTLQCKVVQVTDPQRGKKSASFFVVPQNYVTDGQTVAITDEYYGKYSKTILSVDELKKIPPSKVIKKTALTVGSHFVKGLSTGVYFAEGVIESKGKQPLRSGVKKAYKESPLSYVEKGEELDIKPGEEFYLVFKISDTGEEPNYDFTEPAN